jgi:hypothetical protein
VQFPERKAGQGRHLAFDCGGAQHVAVRRLLVEPLEVEIEGGEREDRAGDADRAARAEILRKQLADGLRHRDAGRAELLR